MSFPQYPEYKDSGEEWLGDVPAHWAVRPLKFLVSFRSGGTPSKTNDSFWDGDLPWASAKDMKSESLRDTEDHLSEHAIELGAADLLPPGTVVVVVRGMILAKRFPVAVIERPMAINQDLKALLPIDGLNPQFLAMYLRGSEDASLIRLEEAAHGTKALRMESWASLLVALPSSSEQSSIVSFLSCELDKIDGLVVEQEKLIALLRVKRHALISHAVTRGLDPSVPMKNSGIELFGEVPAHWKVSTIRRIASRVDTGGTPTSVVPSDEFETGLAWYTPGDFDGTIVLEKSFKKIPRDLAYSGEAKVFPSASVLVVSIGATLGKVAYANQECSANQQVNVVVPTAEVDGYFLTYSLSVKAETMRFLSNASTIGIMNQEKTKEIPVAIPPRKEQLEICVFLDQRLSVLEDLVTEAQRAVGLLTERRSALISAVVTGKIDVREWRETRAMSI